MAKESLIGGGKIHTFFCVWYKTQTVIHSRSIGFNAQHPRGKCKNNSEIKTSKNTFV